MKHILILAILLATATATQAQIPLPRREEQRAKDKTGYKVDETVDKSIDSAFSKTGRPSATCSGKKIKVKKKTNAEEARNNEMAPGAERKIMPVIPAIIRASKEC